MSERTTTDLLRAVDDTVVGTGLWNIIHSLVDELFERVIDLEADAAGWKEAHHKCAEFAAALEAQLSEMQEAVTRLSSVILDEIPGEPSASEGAIDCAIRLLRERNDHP